MVFNRLHLVVIHGIRAVVSSCHCQQRKSTENDLFFGVPFRSADQIVKESF
jgi:hypothetical protein